MGPANLLDSCLDTFLHLGFTLLARKVEISDGDHLADGIRARREVAGSRNADVRLLRRCAACGTCVERCPMDAVTLGDEGVSVVDESRCIGCGCATGN